MNIGSLYKVKNYNWLLFPSKEIATTLSTNPTFDEETSTVNSAIIDYEIAVLSTSYDYEATSVSPESLIVLLEEEGKFKKVMTVNGNFGWIWFTEGFNSCFQEMMP